LNTKNLQFPTNCQRSSHLQPMCLLGRQETHLILQLYLPHCLLDVVMTLTVYMGQLLDK
jgi:MarR-like DNA-binding transcriptional regulator SgrR of sgrS sRNA